MESISLSERLTGSQDRYSYVPAERRNLEGEAVSEATYQDKENNVYFYNVRWFYDEAPILKLMKQKNMTYTEAFNEHFKPYGMTMKEKP